jgi:hypothetical protein
MHGPVLGYKRKKGIQGRFRTATKMVKMLGKAQGRFKYCPQIGEGFPPEHSVHGRMESRSCFSMGIGFRPKETFLALSTIK